MNTSIANKIISQLPVGFVHVDVAGNLVLANIMAMEILQIADTNSGKMDNVPPTNMVHLFQDRLLDSLGRPLRESWNPFLCSQKKQRPIRGLLVQRTAPGVPPQWLEFYSEPEFSEQEITGAYITFSDVTRRIEQEKMIEQQQKTIAANAHFESVLVLAAGMAHEINNPLTIVRGFAEMAEKNLAKIPADLEAAVRGFQKIKQATTRIADIIKSIRSLGERGNSITTTSIDLKVLVNKLIEEGEGTSNGVGVTLTTAIAEQVHFNSDGEILKQILSRLIRNAVQAVANAQNKLIEIRGYFYLGSVVIDVIDSGPGIAPEKADLLFIPFFTTREPGEGVGMGLAHCKRAANLLGGNILLVKDEPRTTFRITLPLARDKDSSISGAA